MGYVINNWSTILQENKFDHNTSCINVIYWLYGKIKDIKSDVTALQVIYSKFQNFLEENCYKSTNDKEMFKKYIKSYDMEVLKNKKLVYDFLEYYSSIKNVLPDNKSKNNNEYCKYIKYMFNLYKYMKQNNGTHVYCEEIRKFVEKFKGNDELKFLQSKCSSESLNINFEDKVNDNCELPSEDSIKVLQKASYPKDDEDYSENFNISETKEVINIGNDIWENTPLSKFYNELNLLYKDEVNNIHRCKSFISNNVSKGANIYNICNNLKNILEGWDTLLTKHNLINKDDKKHCDYLNYWLHGKIKGNYCRKRTIKFLYKEWDKINEINDKSNTKCSHKDFLVSENAFIKKKNLFDFIEQYDSVKSELGELDISKKKKYCEYIKNHFELYFVMKHEDICKKNLIYDEEKRMFKTKFIDDEKEVEYIKKNCNDKYIETIVEVDSNNVISNVPNKFETIKQKYVSEELPSHMKYKEFDKNDKIDDYCSYCTDLLPYEIDNPGINALCKIFAKNLYGIKDKSDRSERCSYFYYWMYDKLWKNFGINSNHISKKPVVLALLSVVYRIIYKLKIDECFYNFNSNDTFHVWEEKKYLHDYFKNFNTINKCITSKKDECKTHCEYVKHIATLYEKYIKKCCIYYYNVNDIFEKKCSDYFECDLKYNPYSLLTELQCDNPGEVEDIKEILKDVTIDQQVKILTKKYSNHEYSHNVLKESTFHEPVVDNFYTMAGSYFLVIGAFLGFFIFYKFTPIGSCIRNRRAKKKRVEYNYIKQNQRLPNVEPEYNELPPQRRRVRIAYQAT
ncbi:Plasmodium vivax Vir protein, putative [Plasmodium vivax]|uniref:Vir protein, putative n=1 Tax=Plasmodium vivax TaxID=5855 RepID=A0A1G4E6A7_PLAVI|nr:Plasmodium vivax Vir protein, putative [Plasmodium vivax]